MDNPPAPSDIVEATPISDTSAKSLSELADMVVRVFERPAIRNHERRLTVNPVVSKVASWYEKLRNSMEYHEEEVILRASIERVLKRRLLLGGNAKTTAEPLVRELIWGGYLKDDEVPESHVAEVERIIELYLTLRLEVLRHKAAPEAVINEWTYQLMSSAVEHALNPNPQKQAIASFMFQVLRDDIAIIDESEETKDAQVYIAIRRAYARDDIAFLRYHLFLQYFGELNRENIDTIAQDFGKGYDEITKQLRYPKREKIYAYVKKRTAVFLILEDLLLKYKGQIRHLAQDEEALHKAVFEECEIRYKGVANKVRTAIIRSVLFILFTKVIFGFAIEGTYERLVYGEILWNSLLINIAIPPLLMIVVSFFIRTPGKDNSEKVFNYIDRLLFDPEPRLGTPMQLATKQSSKQPLLNAIFTILWLIAFVISFGGIAYVLTQLHFNIVSQGIFIFFLAIVSFMTYRISLIAKTYSVGTKQTLLTPFVDFFFVPVVQVGRKLTQGISQINILLFIFDFLIDAPFKAIFAFAEQLFHFLHSKRDELE
jgi:hypothetical protein